MSAGAGMSDNEVFEDVNIDSAENAARIKCVELAESYDFHQDEDFFGELDSLGKDWLDEDSCYEQEGFLDYVVEEYDPEKHDDEL